MPGYWFYVRQELRRLRWSGVLFIALVIVALWLAASWLLPSG